MADARTAFLITIDDAHEGGFQDNPRDRANWTGGEVGVGTLVGTKYGITTLDMPGMDIRSLTAEQALDFYIARYWKPLYSDITDQSVANKLADVGVLFGVGTAVKAVQTALGLVADGIFGPQSLQKVNASNPADVLSGLEQELVSRARVIAASNPNDAADLSDWIRRIES